MSMIAPMPGTALPPDEITQFDAMPIGELAEPGS